MLSYKALHCVSALAESSCQEDKTIKQGGFSQIETAAAALDHDTSSESGLWERVQKRLRQGARWFMPTRR